MLDQMGIFISRHADHVEKRAGARDGAMPSWISTWSQENPPLGLEIQCHFEISMPLGMWKMFHLGVGKVSNENSHMYVFQKNIFTNISDVTASMFQVCYNQSLRIIPFET